MYAPKNMHECARPRDEYGAEREKTGKLLHDIPNTTVYCLLLRVEKRDLVEHGKYNSF